MNAANNRRRRDHALYREDLPRPSKAIDPPNSNSRYPQDRSDVAEIWDARRRNDIDAWITLVRHAPNLEALREMQNGFGRDCTVCIDALPDENWPGRKDLNTIEFRQHVGTIQPREAIAYVDFLARVVESCHTNTNEEAFYNLIGEDGRARQPQFKTLELLRRMGCSVDTQSHYTARLDSRTKDSFSTWLDAHEKAAKALKAEGNPMGKLALDITEWQRQVTDPENVDERILHKLKIGGYGQFNKGFLDKILTLDVDVGVRIHLTIGYFAPLNCLAPTRFEVLTAPSRSSLSKDTQLRGAWAARSDSGSRPYGPASSIGGNTELERTLSAAGWIKGPNGTPSPPSGTKNLGWEEPLSASASYVADSRRSGSSQAALSRKGSDRPSAKVASPRKAWGDLTNHYAERAMALKPGPDVIDQAAAARLQQPPRTLSNYSDNSSEDRAKALQLQRRQRRQAGSDKPKTEASSSKAKYGK